MGDKLKYFLITAIIFLAGNITYAQEKEYIYDHYNISNGLISDNVFKLFMDQSGYTWIITYNGLQKFNGYKFKTYTSMPGSPGTLSSNFVVNIFEDRDGDIIIVLDDGIDIYHRQTDRFTNLLSDLPFAEVKRNEISRQASIVQDRAGSIWTTCNNQLVRIDSSKENFFIYQDEFRGNFTLNHDSTLLWIITEETIKKYDLETKVLTIKNIRDIPSPVKVKRLNTIFFDSEGSCWIGTTGGLFKFDEEKYCLVEPEFLLPENDGDLAGDLNRNITAIYEDYNKDIWVASGTLLFRIDRNSGVIQCLRHEIENVNSILDEQITGIYGNRSGTIWVTYLNEGFTNINIRTENFRSYRFKANSNQGLGGKTVRSVHKDKQGYIWVGLYNDGLDRIDPGTGHISHFKYDQSNENGICSNYIASVYLDDKQRLWVGSHDNGLCYSDNIYDRNLSFHRPSFLNSNDEIYHILEDTLGRIWFGTRTGLGMYDYSKDIFRWVLVDHNVQSFIFENRTIWIASWDHGLCKLNFSSGEFASDYPEFDTATSLNYQVENRLGSEADFINPDGIQNCISIYQDKMSNVWIGTYDKGLARTIIHDNECSYILYDESSGAPGNAVYGILGDDDGNIWISTEHGLGKFDPVSEHFENYHREDGLLSNYFMWKAYYQAPDGELLFGNVDGLNLFYPGEIRKDPVNSRVLISDLRIQNQPVNFGDTIHGEVILHKHITFQDTLILNYKNNTLSLEFFASGYINPDQIRYAHMLDGYDENWIEHENGSRLASYNNLPPGTYTFRVKSTESNGFWNESVTEKRIIILPPWWKTRLAYALYLLVLLGLIFLIAHSLVKFLGLKHELIYNEKLHQSKLMFFTNVSHEFKTPLSLIIAPLNEILNKENLSPHSRKNLGIAKLNADHLLSLVNELMEFRRTEAGISKLKPEQIELISFVTRVAQQFECVADQRGIQFYINFPQDKLNVWVDIEKFRKIINNLIENALKHTPSGGLITLSIIRNPEKFKFRAHYHSLQFNTLNKATEYIGILISDSGVGISRESLPNIFDRFYQIEAERASHHIGSGIGLALVKNLVLMHHGEIRVASERGEGTDILVLLPLGKDVISEAADKDKTLSLVSKKTDIIEKHHSIGSDQPVNLQTNQHLPRILIIEDNLQLRNYLSENFSDEFNIIEAANGKEGIRQVHESKPDLIITDWIMPVMDGGEFLKKLKSNELTASIPVLFLTAKDEPQDQSEALNLGADQIVTKPFNLSLLKSQVKRMVENNKTRIHAYGIDNSKHLTEFQDQKKVQYIESIESVIYENIRNTNLNAAFIARKLACSRTALYTKIKEMTGLTIGEYIQKIRLKQAVKLMLYENYSVSEVYFMVGISSSSYLIRLFKKYYHTTPREYIKNLASVSSL